MSLYKKTEWTDLRIIGGALRSRKLRVPVREGLRPTHDRIRETLFNWLGVSVVGMNCLDAFAGSGALGFEAISRGASSVSMVEKDPELARAITTNSKTVGVAQQIVCHNTSWPGAIKNMQGLFDLVFLDPPFDGDQLLVTWRALIEHKLLADNAWVYIETKVGASIDPPDGFSCYRLKKTKQVVYGIFQRE